ncbi:hypothetical protein [Rhodococcus spongiicola]|uniref:DUF4232 domain-containing protein n=1 Tax=Rhodococcus spongiicola TaxID=2487352 RepID=A0A438B6P4_9NOCA|nr:hypothetical protein [Rhodococcus spongiicola]RVW06635.1 hypothetical protein EF834_04355 [Rhodococcus spongiicola]
MFQPTGPLPPEVYWRRRLVALGVLVVVIALIVWIITAVTGGGASEPAAAADTSETTETNAPPSEPSDATAEASEDDAAEPAAATSDAEPAYCTDQSLAIKATPDQPQYRVGEEPSFTIAITNIGTVTCERDLGSGLQQVLVYTLDGNRRLWSNIDCYPYGDPAVEVLEPGGQRFFTIRWSGTTSDPGCLTVRNQVPAGAYTLVAQLGELRSSPEPFNLA